MINRLQLRVCHRPKNFSCRCRCNPLETLRTECDPAQRARLLASLDGKWSEYTNTYQPSAVEGLLCKELGADPHSVMTLAVGSGSKTNPPLCMYDVGAAMQSIRAMKGADIDVADIWFIVTRKPTLLTLKEAALQRWLDFLTVYGVKDKDLVNFLLQATPALLEECTLYQAGQVVTFLKQLGMKNEFLAKRVFAVWPDILGKDVDLDLRPIVSFLMQLGMEVTDLAAMISLWPELLLCKVDRQLTPFVEYLRSLGCSTAQLAEMLTICPHLLGFKPEELFGHRLSSLGRIGVGPDDVKVMIERSLVFLTAGGGVQAQVDYLLGPLGLSPPEARQLVLAAPELLAEKDFDLDRKWRFIQGTMNVGKEQVLACPRLMAASLMQVLGPRYTFLRAKGLHESLLPLPKSQAPLASNLPPHDAENTSASLLLLTALVTQTDVDWCQGMGVGLNEFREHSAHFQTDYNEQVSKEAAKEFQEELKKLGIYEGSE